jgi:3-oxoacyl-[acyl-carrier protein] reductase/pteridine reductase
MDLGGKTALVTGGAHRVGRAIVIALARAGAKVAINYNTSAGEAAETVTILQKVGGQAVAIQADVGDPAQAKFLIQQTAQHFGSVDLLVNNASTYTKTPLPFSAEVWRRTMNVILDGAFHCANAAAPHMQTAGGGVIINIADLHAVRPSTSFTAHGVAKAGLLALTEHLAVAFAPHIRVNAVIPGPVLPPARLDPEAVRRIAERTLLKRWGTPEDVASAVLFLTASDYITGESLVVDGGERWVH